MWLNFESSKKAVPNSLLLAAGIDIITIYRKDLWSQIIPARFLNCGYCYRVYSELPSGLVT
jgi:hypothetical protein